jgi:chromosome segregation ATPase
MDIDTSFTKTFGGCGLEECLQKYFQAKFTNGLAVHDSYQRIVEAIHAHGMEMATKSSADLSARIRLLEAERDKEQQRYEVLRSQNVALQHELARAEAKAAEVIASSNERDDFERLLMQSNAELTKENNSAHAAIVAAQDELARITQINDNTADKLANCRQDLDAVRRRYVDAKKELDNFSVVDADFAEVAPSVLRKCARKIGGSFQADGNIVADFTNMAGERRLVLEFAAYPGMLHIYNPNQIEIAE